MNGIPWSMIGLGLSAGAAIAVLYLAGLAASIRLAVRSTRAAPALLCSAVLRIALLLGIGLAVSRLGAAAFGGFALGFMIVRIVIVSAVRLRASEKSASWS